MRILSAENRFRRGLTALVGDDSLGAVGHFRAALDLQARHGVPSPSRRYLSYYGYALVRSRRSSRAGMRACREAVAGDCTASEPWLNLGRALVLTGRTRDALDAFETGLSHHPDDAALRRERDAAVSALGLATPRPARRGRVLSSLLSMVGA